MSMTPEAKSRLSKVIRGTQNANNGGLRQLLLDELQAETERRYRLTIKNIKQANLNEAHETKRRRLQDWIDEQVRAETGSHKRKATDFLQQAVKQAAYTLLNRLVFLKLMEGMGLRKPLVLTGGWNSSGYRDFRALGATLARDESDRSEGFSFLLKLIFEDLATELPGLFGSAGIADLIPVTDSLLQTIVEAFDNAELETCWSDDMTLGWVYQYWNDPEREAIDAKLNDGGKVEPHEIASKTQMFTERYMVDWLLQNSLGPMWLAMCRQHGWTPDCEADGTLAALEQRRIAWRAQRDAGEVELTDLMPLQTDMERRWAYYVPQPIPDDAVQHAPDSVRDLKILDPAVGSGHFLVVAFDLLVALYEEEARHRAEAIHPAGISPSNAPAIYPAGISAISRGSSEAKTPGTETLTRTDPGRVAPSAQPATPPGSNAINATESGGAPTGDPRLIAQTPPGSNAADAIPAGSNASDATPPGSNASDAIPAGSNAPTLDSGVSTLDPPPSTLDFTPTAIVERILEHNLHGIDLDPRAVQIAAAALWLKAQTTCPDAQPKQLNLVASNLGITSLADDDAGLVELRKAVEQETGIPATLTNQIVEALRGAEHLGSLLKVDAAIAAAIDQLEDQRASAREEVTYNLFGPDGEYVKHSGAVDRTAVETGILSALENFLSRHTSADELGLRLRGQQLAAGVRFLRMNREGVYDLIVANPPYQGTSKLAQKKYVETQYTLGKADLFAAFLLRGLQLVRPHGVSAMLTMRNWMFIKQYSGLRQHLLEEFDLRALGDLSSGAFQEINAAQVVVSVAMTTFGRRSRTDAKSVAVRPFDDETLLTVGETQRKRAATLCHIGRHEFDPAALKVVPECPLVYWWDESLLRKYQSAPLIGDVSPSRAAQSTGDNVRFIRCVWEIDTPGFQRASVSNRYWQPLIKGAAGTAWCEPLGFVVAWGNHGLPLKASKSHKTDVPTCSLASEEFYLNVPGVAFSAIGAEFTARAHRYPSVFESMGSSIFPLDLPNAVCAMNSSTSREILTSLNPTVHFQVGDVNRLPLFQVSDSRTIWPRLEDAFTNHESHREPSVEFLQPGPSPWRYAQQWAQRAVDRDDGQPLPEYLAQLDPEPPTDHISFALGVALGRFEESAMTLDSSAIHPAGIAAISRGSSEAKTPGSQSPKRTDPGGVEDGADSATPSGSNALNATDSGGALRDPRLMAEIPAGSNALPHGILFLDGTLADNDLRDGLGLPQAKIIHDTWQTHGHAIAGNTSVRKWLRTKFFSDVHKGMYENRPIHWPLTSANKTFVAWINIHRWNARTLTHLLAKLNDTLRRINGEIEDLQNARNSTDKSAARDAKDTYDDTRAWKAELENFIVNVQQCADKGPPFPEVPAGKQAVPPRDCDAAFDPDLDDGVMINSAALWPLLDPVWKDPKKWWIELANANPKGNKDYDWSHLAMKYWPDRVDGKCQTDPSLAVAHGCFWKYHPAKAWKWELRLQDEIGPDFRIEETTYREDGGDAEHRTAYFAAKPAEALEAVEKELIRRRGKKGNIRIINQMILLEPGLWSALPEVCWDIESKFIKKQNAACRLIAPDEVEARKALLKSKPALQTIRQTLMNTITPHDPFASVGVIGENQE